MTAPIDELFAVELVITYEHFKRWAIEQERFAKAIPENDPRYNAALFMLEHTGQAITRAGGNMRRGAWCDDAVRMLMLDVMAKRAEVMHWAELMRHGRAQKDSEIASEAKRRNARRRMAQVSAV